MSDEIKSVDVDQAIADYNDKYQSNWRWCCEVKTSEKNYKNTNFSTLETHLMSNRDKSGYEIIMNDPVVPYYDFDFKNYRTKQDAIANEVEDYKKIITSLRTVYNDPKIKFYISKARHPKTDSATYKNSFHVTVRGFGYFKNNQYVYQLREEDPAVYNPGTQKFRMIYCDKDGDTRIFEPCYLKNEKLLTVPKNKFYSDYAKLTGNKADLRNFFISYIGFEKLITGGKTRSPKKLPPDHDLEKLNRTHYSQEEVEELVETCLVPDKKQKWEYQDWRNFCFCMSKLSKDFKCNLLPLAKRVEKMYTGVFDPNEAAVYLFKDPSAFMNRYGFGWLVNFCKKKARESERSSLALNNWMKKHKLKNRYDWFRDCRVFANSKFVELEDVLVWAQNTIIPIWNGQNKFILTRNCKINKNNEYTAHFTTGTEKSLFSCLKVFVNLDPKSCKVIGNRIYPKEKNQETNCESTGCHDIRKTATSSCEKEYGKTFIMTKSGEQFSDDETEETAATMELERKRIQHEKRVIAQYDQLDKIVDLFIRMNLIQTYNTQVFIPWGYGQDESDVERLKVDSFNTFTGFDMETYTPRKVIDPRETLFYNHLYEQLAAGDIKAFGFILGWLAHLIQKPYELPETVLNFISEQGNGKDLFFEFIGSIIGEKYVAQYNNVDSFFDDNFNSKREDKLLYSFNELAVNGKLSSKHDRFKGEVTAKTMDINIKFMPTKQGVPHYGRYMTFSNHMNAVTVELSDRRMAIFVCKNDYVNKQLSRNRKYWNKIVAELKDRDVAYAWYEMLGTMDISKFDVRVVPETVGKQQAKLSQMSSVLQWFKEYVSDVKTMDEEVVESKKDLYQDYKVWSQETGEREVKERTFHDKLKPFKLKESRRRIKGKSKHAYTFTKAGVQTSFQQILRMPDFEFEPLGVSASDSDSDIELLDSDNDNTNSYTSVRRSNRTLSDYEL